MGRTRAPPTSDTDAITPPGIEAAVRDFAQYALNQPAARSDDHCLTADFGPVALAMACRGDAMSDVLVRTLQHAATAGRPADLAILAIDSRSAGCERPPVWLFPASGPRAHVNRMEFDQGRIAVILNAEWRSWTVLDRAGRRAVIWVGDVAAVPEWVVYDQVRNLLHALAAGRPWGLFHAAAVRAHGAGLLLTGPSGSGKSTMTGAALRAGFDTAGDDFVLIEDEAAPPRAHAVFDTVKLTDRSLALLPELAARIRNPLRRIEDKALVHLSEVAAERLASGFGLQAILQCRVTGEPGSRITACPPALVLKALAPSTVFLLRDRQGEIFRRCAALCRRLPTHAFAIGSDLAAAVACLDDFARGLGG